jgi:hypothetical protein
MLPLTSSTAVSIALSTRRENSNISHPTFLLPLVLPYADPEWNFGLWDSPQGTYPQSNDIRNWTPHCLARIVTG